MQLDPGSIMGSQLYTLVHDWWPLAALVLTGYKFWNRVAKVEENISLVVTELKELRQDFRLWVAPPPTHIRQPRKQKTVITAETVDMQSNSMVE